MSFLDDALGREAAAAVLAAVAESPRLAPAVLPRAALAWARVALAAGYEGASPGAPGATVLAKSTGWTVSLPDGRAIDGDDETGFAAAVLVAAGHGPAGAEPPRAALQRLGKALDGFAAVARRPAKLIPLRTLQKAKGTEKPGPAHAPQAPMAPQAPAPPRVGGAGSAPPVAPAPKGAPDGREVPGIAKPPQPAKPAAGRGHALTRSEAAAPCAVCSSPQLRGQALVGCVCHADVLAKSDVTPTATGWILRFNGPDRDSFVNFLDQMRGAGGR